MEWSRGFLDERKPLSENLNNLKYFYKAFPFADRDINKTYYNSATIGIFLFLKVVYLKQFLCLKKH